MIAHFFRLVLALFCFPSSRTLTPSLGPFSPSAWWWQLALVPSFFLLSACDPYPIPPHSRALKPGDADYPQLNPSPSQPVQLTLIAPDGLPVGFVIQYSVSWHQEGDQTPSAPAGCRWTYESQFSVEMPLGLKKSGNVYRGSFFQDYFQPGVCGWHIHSLVAPIVRTDVAYFNQALATNSHSLPGVDFETNTTHIRCTRNRRTWPGMLPPPYEETDCTVGLVADLKVDLPNDFWQSIPADQRLGSYHVNQYLRRLRVEFHDLDPMISDYVRGHPIDAARTP